MVTLFVTPEQIEEEFQRALQLIIDVYEDFNLTDYRFRLSLRDPEDTHKYFDNDEMWENAQRMLKAAVDDMGVDYFEAEGEAAFYGPKLDIKLRQPLVKKKPFLPSNLTSCFQNASTLNTSELMVKSTVQL